mmetsp:Transcript_18775/g.41802  ORF Transcript_18775/g.41802 Transcript_18775/m.41802 type:complete len:223 (-) Transcript_18775:95-763(-)
MAQPPRDDGDLRARPPRRSGGQPRPPARLGRRRRARDRPSRSHGRVGPHGRALRQALPRGDAPPPVQRPDRPGHPHDDRGLLRADGAPDMRLRGSDEGQRRIGAGGGPLLRWTRGELLPPLPPRGPAIWRRRRDEEVRAAEGGHVLAGGRAALPLRAGGMARRRPGRGPRQRLPRRPFHDELPRGKERGAERVQQAQVRREGVAQESEEPDPVRFLIERVDE